MSITENEISCFCSKCEEIANDLKLDKTFADLEFGGEKYNYNSIVFCLIDAVFSIGVRYESVKNTVERYAKHYGLNLYDHVDFDNHKIDDFLNNYNEFLDFKKECSYEASFAKCILRNEQKTSSKNGILKADACYEIAIILQKFGICSLSDFRSINEKKWCSLEEAIKAVKGQGSGIMFSYFCMLSGDDNSCKPDRWIKDFLKDIGIEKCNEDIQELFRESCNKLKENYSKLTPRYLDYQIWSYQRKKEKKNEQ